MRGRGERPLQWRVFGEFHDALHLHRQLMMRILGERGIHPGQAICLRELAHNEGVTQCDLAEILGVSRPTVTVMLQKMEAAGLVERAVDEDDQRYTRIHLTDAGWRGHEEMHALLEALIGETIGRLTEAEQRDLGRLLGKLKERFAETLGGQAGSRGSEPGGPGGCAA